MIRVSGFLCALALCCLPAARGTADVLPVGGATSEVVVTLASPPLAGLGGRAGREARRVVEREQAAFAAALRDTIPGASIHRRYRLVLNGAAIVVPAGAVPRLRALPGVKAVDAGASYPVASDHHVADRTRCSHLADGPVQPG